MEVELNKLVCISELLQSRIRNKSIHVPKIFHGTLPTNVEEQVDFTNYESYSTIFADSFGPFRPLQYFQSKYKVMFILKETYLEDVEEETNFSEGHNKANEYVDLEWTKQPKTYQVAAQMCFSLLNNREYDKKIDKKEDVLECFWDNACIINVNKFPCIASDDTSSNDNYIFHWAQLNESLIQKEIDLYQPDIIIGGHTLGHFVRCEKKGEGSLFKSHVSFLFPDEIKQMFAANLGKYNYAYMGNKLFINSKHPSAAGGDQSKLLLEIRRFWNRNK